MKENLISSVTFNSKGQIEELKKVLEETAELLKRANDAFNSKYTLEFYDEFLLTYIKALEFKIDGIIAHAKSLSALSEVKIIDGSIAEVFNKYQNKRSGDLNG